MLCFYSIRKNTQNPDTDSAGEWKKVLPTGNSNEIVFYRPDTDVELEVRTIIL